MHFSWYMFNPPFLSIEFSLCEQCHQRETRKKQTEKNVPVYHPHRQHITNRGGGRTAVTGDDREGKLREPSGPYCYSLRVQHQVCT
jgi:hypothetical protein